MNILVVDVGGSHVKILLSGQTDAREFVSGASLTARRMVMQVKKLAAGWKYSAVALGFPGPVLHDKPVAEPRNLGSGWVGFDYAKAFGCRVRIVNDAAMQALGDYRRGRMLFLGLGTGLGSALIVDGVLVPMELGHLPFRKHTYEHYVGEAGFARHGKQRWRRDVEEVVSRLVAAVEADDVVIGGGNAPKLKRLPGHCRLGENSSSFLGGVRLWDTTRGHRRASLPSKPRSNRGTREVRIAERSPSLQ
jgi:polyphosphate glucokinase